MNEHELVNNILLPNFILYLEANLNYKKNNFDYEVRIENKIIDLAIIDKEKIIAIVEFKSWLPDFQNTENQVRNYLSLIKNENCPAFLIYGSDGDIFLLQSYGWQKIELQNFPTFETLRK